MVLLAISALCLDMVLQRCDVRNETHAINILVYNASWMRGRTFPLCEYGTKINKIADYFKNGWTF